MAVRPQKDLAWNAETLHVQLMGYPVPGTAENDPVACRCGLEKPVVIGILVIGLEKVMVYVLCRKLCFHPVDSQGLEFQQGHSPCGILKQGVINLYPDLGARDEPALRQMGFQNLMGEIPPHHLSTVYTYSILAQEIVNRAYKLLDLEEFFLDTY
jgi:hypothetical protein